MAADSIPCNSGDGPACVDWPYELIAADLAAAIGDEDAREACVIVGEYAQRLGRTQMLSGLLVAFGRGIQAQAAAHPVATHPRRAPFVVRA